MDYRPQKPTSPREALLEFIHSRGEDEPVNYCGNARYWDRLRGWDVNSWDGKQLLAWTEQSVYSLVQSEGDSTVWQAVPRNPSGK